MKAAGSRSRTVVTEVSATFHFRRRTGEQHAAEDNDDDQTRRVRLISLLSLFRVAAGRSGRREYGLCFLSH